MKTNDIKILQIIDTLDVGGAEKIFINMLNLLSKNNYQITAFFILSKGKLSEDLDDNISIIELFRNSKFNLKNLYQCYKIVRSYDILHCHSWHVYRYIKLVCFLFRVKSKIILQDHYGNLDSKSMERLIYKTILKPKYYIGVSSISLDWITNLIKIDKKNVFLLRNIIHKYEKKNFQNIKDKSGIVLVSNIKEIKNQLFAVKLLNNFEDQLSLIGIIQNKSYYQSILLENPKHKLISNITNVQEVLLEYKLGLHCSKKETGPLVLIEYLAQNLPFLSYETGEVSKILKPHFPEYFIDNFEIKEWEKRIHFLLNSKPDINKMNSIFDKYFSSENYFNELIKIYTCIRN